MGKNSIGDPGCEKLAEALAVNSSLQILEYAQPHGAYVALCVRRCMHACKRACDCGEMAVTASARRCGSLGMNSIGEAGCSTLAKALAVNSSLQRLQ